MNTALLYFFIAGSVLGTLAMLRLHHVFHAALAFLVVVISLAGIFVLLQAEFLGITQILIYAGGIVVIIIFGIMLTARTSGKPLIAPSRNFALAALAGALLFALLFQALHTTPWPVPPVNQPHAIRQLGAQLMIRNSLAFELAGLLLLVSLLAAAVTIAHEQKGDER